MLQKHHREINLLQVQTKLSKDNRRRSLMIKKDVGDKENKWELLPQIILKKWLTIQKTYLMPLLEK